MSQVDFQKAITTMFGTPFVSVDWPDVDGMNQQIYDLVIAEEQSDDLGRGIRSNSGGWQSRGNLLTRSGTLSRQAQGDDGAGYI